MKFTSTISLLNGRFMRQPVFSLSIPDNVKITDIEFYVEPKNWLAKLIWRFTKNEVQCTWTEEPNESQ